MKTVVLLNIVVETVIFDEYSSLQHLQHLFEKKSNNVNVFTVIFDQFNATLLWPQTFAYMVIFLKMHKDK